jgi:hypothetical protein
VRGDTAPRTLHSTGFHNLAKSKLKTPLTGLYKAQVS